MDRTSKLISILSVIAGILLIVAVISSVITLNRTSALAKENQQFIACVSEWANQTTQRSATLSPLTIERGQRLDILIRDFALANSKDPKVKARLKEQFFSHLRSYIRVSDQYNRLAKSHPVPKSPKLVCANDK